MEPWEVALRYKGVPFRHRGRTRNGLDCAGLLVRVALDMNYPVKDLRVYGREPYKDGLRKFLVANCGAPVKRAPQVNDILLLRHVGAIEPSHLALVAPHPTGELAMIHTYSALGKVVMHRLDPSWRQRTVEIYAWPERDEEGAWVLP